MTVKQNYAKMTILKDASEIVMFQRLVQNFLAFLIHDHKFSSAICFRNITFLKINDGVTALKETVLL